MWRETWKLMIGQARDLPEESFDQTSRNLLRLRYSACSHPETAGPQNLSMSETADLTF
jgi:hypothetical protein